jgi:hypothetical protein
MKTVAKELNMPRCFYDEPIECNQLFFYLQSKLERIGQLKSRKPGARPEAYPVL